MVDICTRMNLKNYVISEVYQGIRLLHIHLSRMEL
jgi:hypothetical protein